MPYIGIDFGTSNSVVANFQFGQAEVVPNHEGQKWTPSIVTMRRDGTLAFGQEAKENFDEQRSHSLDQTHPRHAGACAARGAEPANRADRRHALQPAEEGCRAGAERELRQGGRHHPRQLARGWPGTPPNCARARPGCKC